MPQLILTIETPNGPREQAYLLERRLTNVGTEPSCDLLVSAEFKGVLFTISQHDAQADLLPTRAKVRINGQAVGKITRLRPCDRIEWPGGAAVYLRSSLPRVSGGAEAGDAEFKALSVLQNIAATLQSGTVQLAFHQILDAIVDRAGAEAGYLLSESAGDSGWRLAVSRTGAAQRDSGPSSRRELFSNTILQEALKRREPVYVENIVGHPWSDAASVIEARIFSAACFPLLVGERVFGAVFLLTRSPGKSIRKETLGELTLLASQAALMLASSSELRNARLENERLRTLVDRGGEQDSDEPRLVFGREGDSPMAEVARKVAKLAPTPLSVLVLGETGTGKEVVARELHARSDRARGPFVALNCAAIPATLLESVLFGHERGAFTGAMKSQQGKFAQADGGTLFLDEIGDLPFELQSKLLRVLQEKQVEPLGGKPVRIDVRVLSATHQDLEAAVKAQRFRQDLYFRLNGSTLRLPPLRERRGDIAVLARHFLERLGGGKGLSAGALGSLTKHSWPGNVRELEQVITRAALLAEGAEITAEDLELELSAAGAEAQALWAGVEELGNLQEAQLAFTREFVLRTLERCGGGRAQAAARLGVSERTLYRILGEMSAKADRGT